MNFQFEDSDELFFLVGASSGVEDLYARLTPKSGRFYIGTKVKEKRKDRQITYNRLSPIGQPFQHDLDIKDDPFVATVFAEYELERQANALLDRLQVAGHSLRSVIEAAATEVEWHDDDCDSFYFCVYTDGTIKVSHFVQSKFLQHLNALLADVNVAGTVAPSDVEVYVTKPSARERMALLKIFADVSAAKKPVRKKTNRGKS